MKFAKRMEQLKGSDIRAILKLTSQSGMISFAGGMPAPELFPVEEIRAASDHVLTQYGKEALQYTITEGYVPLRAQIVNRMANKFAKTCTVDEILITTGAQQGIELSGKLFLDEGDVVLCESPSFLGAFQALRVYEPTFKEVETDDEGMIMDDLIHLLETTDRVKMIYVIPDFQNPTGRSWSLARRRAFMEIVSQYDVVVIEDNPYGELQYDGDMLPSLASMDTRGQVVFLGSFSKICCPGFRIGWLQAAPLLMEKYVMAKQAADTHSSTYCQRVLHTYMDMYDLDANVNRIKDVYRARRNLMFDLMKQHFPQEARFILPGGGLFIWVELPQEVNTRELLEKSLERGVAFVPGGSFYPNGGRENALRLNFSNMSEDKIQEGIPLLVATMKEMLSINVNS
ncbi:PLP-dependent aminotransferase family protein [Paenibacillus sp. N1-5-1-14]|uniref:aminotransferase-like domain-containing protein n=1 Tax=Paenibacillus radicibacter TaxID=2972488 RepID=UPI0021590A30|nr:PLP-dependent aminotransferase family protein [Paenibacillus radicibacter]MCR8644872.1 PLP-dependent aminotransferase family protein [Paenibacillus radicibacter]